MNDEWPIVLVGGIAVLAALLYAGAGDLAETEMQQKHYCAMVDLHKRTGGQHGWPVLPRLMYIFLLTTQP